MSESRSRVGVKIQLTPIDARAFPIAEPIWNVDAVECPAARLNGDG